MIYTEQKMIRQNKKAPGRNREPLGWYWFIGRIGEAAETQKHSPPPPVLFLCCLCLLFSSLCPPPSGPAGRPPSPVVWWFAGPPGSALSPFCRYHLGPKWGPSLSPDGRCRWLLSAFSQADSDKPALVSVSSQPVELKTFHGLMILQI